MLYSINYPPTPPLPGAPRRLILNLDPNPAAAVFSGPDVYWARAVQDASILASSANATVITPHYRLGAPAHPWPRPLHDVAASLSWALEHLAGPVSSIDDIDGLSTNPDALAEAAASAPRLAFSGFAFGASIALALGLTESRTIASAPTKPRIAGVAALHPITDWAFEADPHVASALPPAALPPSMRTAAANVRARRARDRGEPLIPDQECHDEAMGLLRFRGLVLGIDTAARFDPFAAPVHFLRTGSMPVPPRIASRIKLPSNDSDAALSPWDARALDPPELLDASAKSDAMGDADADTAGFAAAVEADAAAGDGRRFRRALRWPPTRSGIVVPPVWISQFEHSTLRGQGEEFVRLLRKAHVRSVVGTTVRPGRAGAYANANGLEGAESDEDAADLAVRIRQAEEQAERLVTLDLLPGDATAWDVEAAAGRMGEMLDEA